MSKTLHVSMFVLLGGLVIFTGCAKRQSTKNQISALQAQVGVLTDELARMDQSLQELKATGGPAPQAQSLGIAGEESVAGGIYRTPSGFTLRSADIQRALRKAGYYQGNVDGKIGPVTRDAIKAFQSDMGLEADGVVGRRTWSKLQPYLEGVK